MSSSYLLLGENIPYSLVAFLTPLNDNFFSGTKMSENSNTPFSFNRLICFGASSEVKTRLPLIEVTEAPLSLLLVDIRLENILESGDLVLMVFTKALLSRSSCCKVNPKVVSGENGVDSSITGKRYVKLLIDNSY